MRLKLTHVCLLAGLVTFAFVGGVVVGQESHPNLSKYLGPTQDTELDRQFQTIQFEEMKWAVEVLQDVEVPNQLGVPMFSLNPKTGKIQALVAVHANWADTAPLKEVQESLNSKAKEILFTLKFHMPEISDRDVNIYFSKVNMTTNGVVNNFAEYRNGELTIKK